MNCHGGSVCCGHCGSQLEGTDSSGYSTVLGTTTLYLKKKKNRVIVPPYTLKAPDLTSRYFV